MSTIPWHPLRSSSQNPSSSLAEFAVHWTSLWGRFPLSMTIVKPIPRKKDLISQRWSISQRAAFATKVGLLEDFLDRQPFAQRMSYPCQQKHREDVLDSSSFDRQSSIQPSFVAVVPSSDR